MKKNVVFITNKKKQKPDTLKPWLPGIEKDNLFLRIVSQLY